MNTQNSPLSNNVEINCLGKTVVFDGGPLTKATLACWDEVNHLRENFVGDNKTNRLFGGPDPNAQATFDWIMGRVSDVHNAPTFTNYVKNTLGMDSFESRQKEFENFVNGGFSSPYEK